MHYRSIFISDIHLGTRGCRADDLCEFLKNHTCDNLFLVGDVIDGWRLKRRWYFPQSHVNVVRRILTAAKRGTRVYYIIGNHDEVLRKFLSYDITAGNITLLDQYEYETVSGKKYLIIHGDCFDSLMVDAKWLMHVGDSLYTVMVWFNIHLNRVRNLFGMQYWSLSKWLKDNTKQAVKFIQNYEDRVATHCSREGYDGIICGHIHHAEQRTIRGINYINTGDWVETGTAVLEHLDGTIEVYFHDKKDTTDNGQSAETDQWSRDDVL
jgi:UDP-2,3-diacylglucosamine pyrophosphatase LpxH